jgi:hypothetical protein
MGTTICNRRTRMGAREAGFRLRENPGGLEDEDARRRDTGSSEVNATETCEAKYRAIQIASTKVAGLKGGAFETGPRKIGSRQCASTKKGSSKVSLEESGAR